MRPSICLWNKKSKKSQKISPILDPAAPCTQFVHPWTPFCKERRQDWVRGHIMTLWSGLGQEDQIKPFRICKTTSLPRSDPCSQLTDPAAGFSTGPDLKWTCCLQKAANGDSQREPAGTALCGEIFTAPQHETILTNKTAGGWWN